MTSLLLSLVKFSQRAVAAGHWSIGKGWIECLFYQPCPRQATPDCVHFSTEEVSSYHVALSTELPHPDCVNHTLSRLFEPRVDIALHAHMHLPDSESCCLHLGFLNLCPHLCKMSLYLTVVKWFSLSACASSWEPDEYREK